jgi:hypothetical protein
LPRAIKYKSLHLYRDRRTERFVISNITPLLIMYVAKIKSFLECLLYDEYFIFLVDAVGEVSAVVVAKNFR